MAETRLDKIQSKRQIRVPVQVITAATYTGFWLPVFIPRLQVTTTVR